MSLPQASIEPILAQIPVEMTGQRLDKTLVALFPDYSRSRLQTWLEEGRVQVNGEVAKKGHSKVRGHDTVVLHPGVLEHMHALVPENIPLEVLDQTVEYTVINKPAGLVVHPAPGHWSGTLMNALLALDPGILDVPRAGIVHRLDADTSGLMVVARTPQAQASLVAMLQARIVKRVYMALVWGRIARPVCVNQPLGRDPRNRLKMAVVDFGKPAVTHFTPAHHGEIEGVPVTLMVCRLETGRTHQIRVHAQYAGFALLGDPTYKPKGAGHSSAMHQLFIPDETASNEVRPNAALHPPQAPQPQASQHFSRQALHAAHLSFINPSQFVPQQPGQSPADWAQALHEHPWPAYEAPPPADFLALARLAGIEAYSPEVQALIQHQADIHRLGDLTLPAHNALDEDWSDDDDSSLSA